MVYNWVCIHSLFLPEDDPVGMKQAGGIIKQKTGN
jgi:hypothetical protein